jgi:hypothetical protein
MGMKLVLIFLEKISINRVSEHRVGDHMLTEETEKKLRIEKLRNFTAHQAFINQ